MDRKEAVASNKRWADPSQVAKTEGVEVQTVYRWIERKRLIVRRTVGGRVRILVDDQGIPARG